MATSVYLSLLTKDYARRAGDVIQLRRDLRDLIKETLRAEADLAALLTVIRRKNPGFDPVRVKPIRTTVQVAGFSHNRLTTSILECLREAAPEPASKETIAMFVADRRGLTLDGSRVEYLKLSRCIQKRLKGMAAAGTVVRHHDKWANGYGLWSLAPITLMAVPAAPVVPRARGRRSGARAP